jgi:hypothetical protein
MLKIGKSENEKTEKTGAFLKENQFSILNYSALFLCFAFTDENGR